jgi:hypothetical protein
MLCALTVRKLKPGTIEQFKETFVPDDEMQAPPGWKHFYALQNVDNENEVVTFGFFDGTLEELRAASKTAANTTNAAPAPMSLSSPLVLTASSR